MSIESLSIALNHSRATGNAKLVLIGIANHDGDGGAWPSIATLSRYAGGLNRRNVQRAVERLEELGEIRRSVMSGGNADTPDHLRPNLYHFTLRCPPHCDRSAQHKDSRKPLVNFEPEGVAVAPPGGGSATGGGGGSATRTIPRTKPRLKEETAPYRARPIAPCGHELIDDRHCILGCRPAELVHA